MFAEGTKTGRLLVLKSGAVSISKSGTEIARVAEPGAVFGEMSILLGTPHTATVRARTPCRAHMITDGDAFLRSNKEIAYDLLKIIAHRLHAVTTYLADLNRYVRSV